MWAGVALGLPAIWLVSRESGALGALATGLFQVATHHGYLSVAAVITALYPAFTVLLAALVLRERVHAAQGVGLGLGAVSVALVAAS
jgi:uncharacterized membrane protein